MLFKWLFLVYVGPSLYKCYTNVLFLLRSHSQATSYVYGVIKKIKSEKMCCGVQKKHVLETLQTIIVWCLKAITID